MSAHIHTDRQTDKSHILALKAAAAAEAAALKTDLVLDAATALFQCHSAFLHKWRKTANYTRILAKINEHHNNAKKSEDMYDHVDTIFFSYACH